MQCLLLIIIKYANIICGVYLIVFKGFVCLLFVCKYLKGLETLINKKQRTCECTYIQIYICICNANTYHGIGVKKECREITSL